MRSLPEASDKFPQPDRIRLRVSLAEIGRLGLAVNFFEKTEKRKRTAGLLVGTAVGEPTDQVARPLLGDRRWVSGEEIVSATICRAKLVPEKNRDEIYLGQQIFFSFCDAVSLKVSISATFQGKSRVLQVAMGTLDAISKCSEWARCIFGIAASGLHGCSRIMHRYSRDRNRRDDLFTTIAITRTHCANVSTNKKLLLGASLVERRWCVCYFLKARGVAQLGSAPALGAGGRPFKSARPDTRQ